MKWYHTNVVSQAFRLTHLLYLDNRLSINSEIPSKVAKNIATFLHFPGRPQSPPP